MPIAKEDKIAQLIAKAEALMQKPNGEGEAEAQALTDMAFKLMKKHGIDMARIDASRKSGDTAREEIVQLTYRVKGIYAKALVQYGFTSVSTAIGELRPFSMQHANNDISFIVVGHKSDAEACIALCQSLHMQCIAGLSRYWRDNSWMYRGSGTAGWRARRSYVIGFMVAASDRIKSSRLQVIEEAGTGSELVLVKRGAAVDDWVEQNLNTRAVRSKGVKTDYSAMSSGQQDGRNAVTGESQLGGNTALQS